MNSKDSKDLEAGLLPRSEVPCPKSSCINFLSLFM